MKTIYNETALRNQILDYLSYKGIMAWLNNTSGNFNLRTQSYYKNPRLKLGVADILAVLPPNGRLLAIEAKVGKNKQTETQKQFQQEIEANGGIYLLVYDVDEVMEFIKGLGITTK